MPSTQTNAFAMYYGLGLGIYQIVVGAFFIAALQAPISALIVLALMISTPIFSLQLTYRFRNNVCNGRISFGRSFLFGLMMYTYAGLILALATYIYFSYFDHGAIANYYANALNTPENIALFDTMNTGLSYDEFIALIRSLSPGSYASNMLINNTFAGAFISALTALIVRK